MKKSSNKSIKQMFKFGATGVLNTFVDYGVFYILISCVNLHKSIAQVISTALAMSGSFFINKYWTFQKGGHGKFSEIVKFITVNIIAMLSVILFTHIFYDIWHIERLFHALLPVTNINDDVDIMICKILSSGLSLIINFFGNKLWVFKSK